jgi:hypothetical protein
MPKNFSAKRLMGIDFSGQDLSEADFSGATLNGCQFVGSTLRSASFVSVRGMGCNFDDANLTDAQFEGARFMASTFRDSIIAGSDLDEASLMGCDLSGAINEAADDDVEEDDVEEDDVEEDDVEEDDESSASDYVHELNLGWVKLEASDHLSGVTGLMNAHLVDGSWVQTRTMNVAFTDCLIHLVESVDRELLLTVLRPGVSDPYHATLTAGESTSLIDKSDESWHARITNQL